MQASKLQSRTSNLKCRPNRKLIFKCSYYLVKKNQYH